MISFKSWYFKNTVKSVNKRKKMQIVITRFAHECVLHLYVCAVSGFPKKKKRSKYYVNMNNICWNIKIYFICQFNSI